MADHLVSEALYLSDPDGLGIEIYADRPRATWHYRDRELAMATDPLDIASLIAAGRGERWDGAPTNTTMGHVHWHVGNLDDAEAFYPQYTFAPGREEPDMATDRHQRGLARMMGSARALGNWDEGFMATTSTRIASASGIP